MNHAIPRYDELNLRDAHAVVEMLRAGAAANRDASCRRASIDVVRAADGDRLIATGDLHDNALHLARLVRAAGLEDAPAGTPHAHLTLHEVIHAGMADALVNEMDFSYRALVRIAALKARHPEHVHTLLANHELAQIVGAGVLKDGINFVRAFNDAVEFTFREHASEVQDAIGDFIRSMPLALRFETHGGVILCCHSLPGPDLLERFDPGILEREAGHDDYTPRWGSAHIMVWGRGQSEGLLESLGQRWGVRLFILGHEKAEDGVHVLSSNTIILNSDHSRGAFLEIVAGHDMGHPAELAREARRLVE